jgi:GT2 family glycosyltransferase
VEHTAPITVAVVTAHGVGEPEVERSLQSIAAQRPGPADVVVAESRAAALAAATGEWLLPVDAGAVLRAGALAAIEPALRRAAPAVYADERSRLAGADEPVDVLKPGWSPRLLLEGNYAGHGCAVRVAEARRAGGYVDDDELTAGYDLLLRLTDAAAAEAVPYVALDTGAGACWPPTAAAEAREAGDRCVVRALERRGETGTVTAGGAWHRLRRRGARLAVTVIVPTRDRLDLLEQCISSVERHTDYPAFDIVIVDNGSTDPATLAYLDASAHRVIRHPGAFNFSDLVNAGAASSSSPLLLLLNNDTQITDAGWLAALVDELDDSSVGAVGCKLVGAEGEAQHEGIGLGIGGYPAMNLDLGHYLGLDDATRDVAAVTAACVLVSRTAFDAIGGFDHELAVGYGDVDFCLRLRAAGYRIVYTPRAVIRHLGQASRGTSPHPDDDLLFGARWPAHRARTNDPFVNPRIEAFVPLWVTPEAI